MRKKDIKGKIRNRILSISLAAAIVISIIPANVFAEENEAPAEEGIVSAATMGEVLSAETGGAGGIDLDALVTLAGRTTEAFVSVNGNKITVDAGGLILLSNTDVNLEGYTIYLQTISGGWADLTQTIMIDETTYSFQGLGSTSYPFSGTLESQDGSYGVIATVPFFKNVDVSKVQFTNLNTLKVKRKNETTALLAQNVSGESGDKWHSLTIRAEKYSNTVGGTTTEYMPGELIAAMADGASLSLGTVTYPEGATVSPASENAGLLCNTMGANSSLSVRQLTVEGTVTVTANSGSAGGLVGRMESGASLEVWAGETADPVTIGSNYTIIGKNAGGLIGNCSDVKLSGAKVKIDGANVKGSAAAGGVGGLIGSYTTGGSEGGFAAYDGAETSTLKVNNVSLETTVDNPYAGGLFGVLELTSDYTISNASVSSTITGKKANYGGLIGQVKGNSSNSLPSLTINGSTAPATSATVNLNSFGGVAAVVGNDENSPVYVKIEGNFTPRFTGAEKGGFFGGAAAYLKAASVMELNKEFQPVGCNDIPKGGGVLGDAARGSTLCLGGTTDLSKTKFIEKNIGDATGQIVGTQESALIYAKSDWTLIRQTGAQPLDDIGTYGEVIRLGGNMGMGTSNDTSGLSAGLISQNATTHKTEFAESAKLTLTDNTFTVSSADQLALIAIEEQTKCAFHIYNVTGTDYYLKSNANITLGADISLAHTGIIGLQRDINVGYAYAGTLDGGTKTLTVAAGEIYGYRGTKGTKASNDTAGSGQIHGHRQVGFFSQANGTMQNLTVAGNMNLYFRGDYVAGGLVAKNTDTGSFMNVTTSVNIQYQGTNGGSVGGLVGVGTSLTFSNCTGTANIDIGNSAAYAGGLIGQYTGATLSVSGTTLKGSMTATGANHARLGGLVSRIAKGSYSAVSVTLTDITVDGQTITGTNINGSTVNGIQIPASCGGLLGYEWNNASVTFGNKDSHSNGLVVKGSSSVTVNGTTETAGLVYAATGYWQVNDINLEGVSVSSGSGDLGLLICRGWKKDIEINNNKTKPYLLYVEETEYQAYSITDGGVTVTNNGGYFDEWVVYTCQDASTITGNGNSVISIATPQGTLVEGERAGIDPNGNTCTSYQNRTVYGKTAAPNPNARYYYDLDVIREKATVNNKLNTPGELVLWAVWRYSEEKTITNQSNIQDYFLIPDKTYDIYGTTIDGGNGEIDLTGYSYYPITIDGYPLEVKDITIKFANQEIETAESKTQTPLDSLNRTTVGTPDNHTQHYMMHSGLLLNYQNSTTSADVTMTVSNVTFQGTIGKGPNDGSGALICGQLGGNANKTTPKYAKVDINGLTLGGITVNADKSAGGYAPLLVNRVGSYTSLTAQQVSLAENTYNEVSSTNNPAATSLIGHVGGETATNISLAFYNGIALSGRTSDSIFSHATLLESFRYADANSSGYYHFNQGEKCTYGKEIDGSKEYEGLQLWYYDTQDIKVTDANNPSFVKFDSEDYLPYVFQPYTNGSDKFHELEINIKSADLTEGCGTYDDPYLIKTPGQLLRAAQFINGGTPQRGWKVNKVDDANAIKIGENKNHREYEVGKEGWNDIDMRTYLRGAYYKIDVDNLDLMNFPGFGSGTYPFVGVIDGNGKTVKINAANNESGLINVSYGSVVQKLTIEYYGTKSFAGVEQPGDNSKQVTEKSYFGGIIGTVKGGDSLIDNVTVTFETGENGFTVATSNSLQCVGGFVGLIQGGGVIFRNMGDTTRNKGYTDTGSKDKYYVDTYIGRVLDGYAINEVTSSGTSASVTFAAGTGKNYSIPDIATDTRISWDNGNISIGNAQQMIIFTDIINSGATSGGSATAYSNGARTRNADYSQIGNVSSVTDTAFDASRTDDTTLGTGNYPYLIKTYAGNEGAFWTACTSATGVSVTFTQDASIDLSLYGNGYRGIGGRYNCTANGGSLTNNTPKITTVTGNNVSIHVENDIAEYKADNFYANAVGGLFNVLRHEGVTITAVNVYGTVKVCAGLGTKNTDLEATYLARAPVGGVIGRDYCPSNENKTLTLTKVSFGSNTKDPRSVIYGECVTGGLIGSSGSYAKTVLDNCTSAQKNNKTVLALTNCSYQNVNITGGVASGGLVASGVPNSTTFVKSGEKGASNEESGIKIRVTEFLTSGSNADIRILYNVSGEGTANGLGGLIGFCGTTLKIEGTESSPVSVQNITVQGAGDTLRARVGGLVGFMANDNNTNGSKADCTIQYANLSKIKIGMSGSYDDNAGSIMGTWYSYGTLKCQDCVVNTADIQANSSGGIVGYAAKGPIQSIKITLSNVTVRKRGNSRYAGGLGGQVSCTFYGQNILMKAFSYVDNYNATNKNINDLGRFFGTGAYARLIGMTIQDSANLPTYEIRNVENVSIGTSNYVVYAGYNSSEIITTAGDIAIKPSQAVDGIGDLHGDTVNPTTVCSAAADTTFYRNVGTKDKLTENIRSTYNDHQDNDVEADFPVVLIDGDASVLKQYLNAATNGGFDSLRKYQSANTSDGNMEVSVDRYLYNKDSNTFSKADANTYPATLVYHSASGEFTTTAQYDNQKDTFTLVTVTMTGYNTSDKFVLHIPVIVRRMLQVDFMATMTSGTVFNKTDAFYSETKNHALASQGESITGYLTFHYNSNSSDAANPASYDWQSYMEAGGDLLGYYKKTVDTGALYLPLDTQITLIDCQNGDKRYYATVKDNEGAKLELFNGGKLDFRASDNTEFTPVTLSDLLQITADPATEADKTDESIIKWVQDAEHATVKAADGKGYRLYDAAQDQTVTDLYKLEVGNLSPKENYFVVISVPKAENHRMTLKKTGMDWSNSTSSPPLEVHQVHRYDPGTVDPENGISEASFNYLENYTQNLVDNTIAESVQIQTTSATAELPISVTNTVSFNSENYKDTDPLYQKLVISLKKREDNVTTSVGMPSDAVAVTNHQNEEGTSTITRENAVKLYAYYKDASDTLHYYVWNGSAWEDRGTEKVPATSYSWSGSADSAEMVLPFAQKTESGYQYINLAGLRKASGNQFYLEAETTLELSVASILSNNTIPGNEAGSGEIANYTQVDAMSILSFTESGLSYSTLRGSTSGRQNIRKYYLNTARNAVLKLDYTNIDQLGINAREDKTAAIDTVLTLDFSNTEGFVSDVKQFKTLSEADTVKFTLSLQKKGGSSYKNVQIGNYLSNAKTEDGNSLSDYTITLNKNADGSYPYYNEQTGQFTIPISFAVNMNVKEYANYRIYADVMLLSADIDKKPDVNKSGAYITYTLAKINVNGYFDTNK